MRRLNKVNNIRFEYSDEAKFVRFENLVGGDLLISGGFDRKSSHACLTIGFRTGPEGARTVETRASPCVN